MSEPIDDGGPAFPVPVTPTRGGGWASCKEVEGMSLRDWFAGQALAGMFAADTPDSVLTADDKADQAYHAADAMLAARKVKP